MQHNTDLQANISRILKGCNKKAVTDLTSLTACRQTPTSNFPLIHVEAESLSSFTSKRNLNLIHVNVHFLPTVRTYFDRETVETHRISTLRAGGDDQPKHLSPLFYCNHNFTPLLMCVPRLQAHRTARLHRSWRWRDMGSTDFSVAWTISSSNSTQVELDAWRIIRAADLLATTRQPCYSFQTALSRE